MNAYSHDVSSYLSVLVQPLPQDNVVTVDFEVHTVVDELGHRIIRTDPVPYLGATSKILQSDNSDGKTNRGSSFVC